MSARNSGENNPFFGRTHDEKIRQKISSNSKASFARMDASQRAACFSRDISGDKNPFFGKKHSSKSREKMSQLRALGISQGRIHAQRGIRGSYNSTKTGQQVYFDSFYEFLRMQMLDSDHRIKWWTKHHKIRIKYEFEGPRHYVPDFLIMYENYAVIEEIKGYEVLEKKRAKYSALDLYAQEEGMKSRVLEFEDLEKLVQEHFGKSIAQLRKEYKCTV